MVGSKIGPVLSGAWSPVMVPLLTAGDLGQVFHLLILYYKPAL